MSDKCVAQILPLECWQQIFINIDDFIFILGPISQFFEKLRKETIPKIYKSVKQDLQEIINNNKISFHIKYSKCHTGHCSNNIDPIKVSFCKFLDIHKTKPILKLRFYLCNLCQACIIPLTFQDCQLITFFYIQLKSN